MNIEINSGLPICLFDVADFFINITRNKNLLASYFDLNTEYCCDMLRAVFFSCSNKLKLFSESAKRRNKQKNAQKISKTL